MSNIININLKNYENLILIASGLIFINIIIIILYYNFNKNINYTILIKIITFMILFETILLLVLYKLNCIKVFIFNPVSSNNLIFKYFFIIKINKINLILMITLNAIILILYTNQRIYINNIDKQIKHLNFINSILICMTFSIINNNLLLLIITLDILNQILSNKLIYLKKKLNTFKLNYLIFFIDKICITLLLLHGLMLFKLTKNLYFINLDLCSKYDNTVNLNIILILNIFKIIIYVLILNFSKTKLKQVYLLLYTMVSFLICILLITKFTYLSDNDYIITILFIILNVLIWIFLCNNMKNSYKNIKYNK